jgi:hypothetical protein
MRFTALLCFISLLFIGMAATLNNREKVAENERLKAQIVHLTIQRDTVAAKYVELLRYDNEGFKKRVEKFCPCLTQIK